MEAVVNTIIYDKVNRVSFPAAGNKISDTGIDTLLSEGTTHTKEIISTTNKLVSWVVKSVGLLLYFVYNFGWLSIFILSAYSVLVYSQTNLNDGTKKLRD